jgi:hypothetical protein
LELGGGDVYDAVGEEFAFALDFDPCEFLSEAVVAEGSGRQMDFSASGAFACHEFALCQVFVELFYCEGFCAHCVWLL